VTDQQKQTFLGVVVGAKAKNGTCITGMIDHAIEQATSRGYGASHIKNVIETGDYTPGNKPNRTAFEKNGLRVIVDDNDGKIVTVIRIHKRKREKG